MIDYEWISLFNLIDYYSCGISIGYLSSLYSVWVQAHPEIDAIIANIVAIPKDIG